MTKKQAIAKGWKISRTMQGGWSAKKTMRLEVAETLTALLKKLR